MGNLLVTGCSGLIGSEVVRYFTKKGWHVIGLDCNLRRFFFGPEGDTNWNLSRLQQSTTQFEHANVDIRDQEAVFTTFEQSLPDAVIHCAAQPSHDLAAKLPFADFDTNARGTLNLLEATRQFKPESPFIFLSTNKVYGDRPNDIPLKEFETRWDYADETYSNGIAEDFGLDQTTHSLFGVSKAAADLLVQEYGRYFQMPTVCFRGGCLTGEAHSAVALHGFLAYLIRCTAKGVAYTINGYKGKQVRDNIHAYDVCTACDAFIQAPRIGEVYNIGGGRQNSISILEAINLAEKCTNKKLNYSYSETPRKGDHICYISDLSKFKHHYPEWDISVNLQTMFKNITNAVFERQNTGVCF